MPDYVAVTELSNLPPGSGTTATVAGKEVALFNVAGTIYAMEDACLHQAQSLGSSRLDGNVVTCRGHDYGVQTYEVKIVDGTIMIALATPSSATE
jgi:nitrite reductase/ring-hydroxylating ferredoxin subunit